MLATKRKYPIGSELLNGDAHFRVFANEAKDIALVIDNQEYPLENEGNGYFNAKIPNLKEGTFYSYKINEKIPLREFKLENGLPHWLYEINGYKLLKTIFLSTCKILSIFNMTLLKAQHL